MNQEAYEKVTEYGNIFGRRMVSRDGHAVRGTTGKSVSILNLYIVIKGIVLYSKPVADKTNEIPVFRFLLRMLFMKNTIVTANFLRS